MKCLVIGLKTFINIDELINILKNKYNIIDDIFNKNDFKKSSNYVYIYTNENIVLKLINLDIIITNDIIEQILFLDIKNKYFPYISILKLNVLQILQNYDKSFILPDSIKFDKIIDLYKNIYVIYFDSYYYITSIDSQINKYDKYIMSYCKTSILSNIHSIIYKYDILIDNNIKFDIKLQNINYVYVLNIHMDIMDIDNPIKYLQSLIRNSNYIIKSSDYIILDDNTENCNVIINNIDLINIILNTDKYSINYCVEHNNINNLKLRYDDENYIIENISLIQINSEYIDKLHVVSSSILEIYENIDEFILPKSLTYDNIIKDILNEHNINDEIYVIENNDNIIDEIIYFNNIN